jgi:hypothetical protein
MHRSDQRLVYYFGTNRIQNHGNGHCCGIHTSKVWHVVVSIIGSQIIGYPIARHVLCHHPIIWLVDKIIQGDTDEIHGQ